MLVLIGLLVLVIAVAVLVSRRGPQRSRRRTNLDRHFVEGGAYGAAYHYSAHDDGGSWGGGDFGGGASGDVGGGG